jgi:DNA-binding transcriptional LysR family regulator
VCTGVDALVTRKGPTQKAELLQLGSAKVQNGSMYDWGDLKFFLAAARSGSTLAASRELGVNQTTVARRIAALEEALKARLFDRSQDGYRLSEAGAAILAQAERVAVEAETLAQLLQQRSRELSGVIRVTTPEALANLVLTPLIGEFMELYPDIRIEVIATDMRLDLARGEADVSLRAGRTPTDAGVVARRLAECPWGLYASETYAQKFALPQNVDDLNNHQLVGADGWLATGEPFRWLAEAAPRAKVRSVSSTLINMVYAIKAGHGVGLLPCAMGGAEPELVECFRVSDMQYQYYLVTREALKGAPHVRAFNDFIVGRAGALKDVLQGRSKHRTVQAANKRDPAGA